MTMYNRETRSSWRAEVGTERDTYMLGESVLWGARIFFHHN